MSVLKYYRQEAKIQQPAELLVRRINEIKAKIKAGEQITAEQYEKALKPVTIELLKTQDIIRELKNEKENPSVHFQLQMQQETDPSSEEQMSSTEEISVMPYYTIPAINELFNNKNAPLIISDNKLPPIHEMLKRTNYENDQDILTRLKTISQSLGGRKSSTGSRDIDEKIKVIQQYRKALKATRGTGVFYYRSPRELVDRLELLVGEIKAGNDSTDIQNEASAISDKLLQQKKIPEDRHKRLYEIIHNFSRK